ncbi:hypothetical protein EJ03DRAFT_39670 [Teratosphaeria nubilosa]|uniref:Uncharacterized protein n=1 Tax=Teratosphaeria nubilosa TaxID=161662 RepID=A0A6G1LG14_9PEZI|nr:hypothetical protein EJ03DRAFT_39670 [Teratosphaeria nubilosa]
MHYMYMSIVLCARPLISREMLLCMLVESHETRSIRRISLRWLPSACLLNPATRQSCVPGIASSRRDVTVENHPPCGCGRPPDTVHVIALQRSEISLTPRRELRWITGDIGRAIWQQRNSYVRLGFLRPASIIVTTTVMKSLDRAQPSSKSQVIPSKAMRVTPGSTSLFPLGL